MPEFILDHGSPEGARTFKSLSSFARGYVEALFFTEEGDDNLGDASVADLAPETYARIVADCTRFTTSGAWLAFEAWRDENDGGDDEQAGRDFWFTRNRHGVGFWDRHASIYGPHRDALDELARTFGEVSVYLGDDGKIYS